MYNYEVCNLAGDKLYEFCSDISFKIGDKLFIHEKREEKRNFEIKQLTYDLMVEDGKVIGIKIRLSVDMKRAF